MTKKSQDLAKYPISQGDFNAWLKLSIDQYVARATKTDNPRLVMVAAQPGAGKSILSAKIRDEFNKLGQKPAEIDIDNFRDKHPRAREISENEPLEFGWHTNASAYEIQVRVFEVARSIPANIIYENTLNSVDHLIDLTSDYKRGGFAFDFHGLIIPAQWSILGIHQRFEETIHTGEGKPRFVPIPYHDQVYEALPRNIDRILKAGQPDIGRLYDMLSKPIWDYRTSPESVFDAIEKERAKPRTENELNDFEDRWNRTIKLLNSRQPLANEPTSFSADVLKQRQEAQNFVMRQRKHIRSVITRHP